MTGRTENLLNTGIYTLPDAARLTRVSTGRIRRWLRGYKFRTKKKEHQSRALWRGQLEPIDYSLALGFLDLIEIRSSSDLKQKMKNGFVNWVWKATGS